jgi:site-specific DNA-methyltransferase (cytosine-N4-specific)
MDADGDHQMIDLHQNRQQFYVSLTPKAVSEIVEPEIEMLELHFGSDFGAMLRKPFADIRKHLSARDRHVRGLALEALAFKLMRLLDMTYIATRLRGTATGGAEVDLIFESSRLVFSRWQVQCKNTAHVSLDDIAKEVGLTHMLKSNVIVVVGTGDVGPAARQYANKVMTDSNLCIVLLDGDDIVAIEQSPVTIVDAFNREAAHAMRLKKLEL